MLVPILSVLAGFVLLAGGSELLVRGATSLALLAGVSASVIGLTVVAAGTSMPELVVSVDAALAGEAEIAVGNVVGSNVFNIGAILGLAALIAPLRIVGNTIRLEWPLMLLAACQLFLMARDGSVDRIEGAFLVLALIAFCAYLVKIARSEVAPAEAEALAASLSTLPGGGRIGRAWALGVLGVVAGCGVLAGGAHLLVVGAVELAAAAGMSETVIGLTVVAAGTSLPELATSCMASLRGRDDIAVGNVVGSNIFNVLGILGISACIHPLEVPAEVVTRDAPWMIGFSALLFPVLRSGMRVSRPEGALLLAGMGTYLAVLLTA